MARFGRSIVAVAGLWLVALLAYLPTALHHDVSWFLVAAGRILDGARPYRDIIEPNPPLAFYLVLPPTFAARLVGLRPEPVFIAYVFGLIAVALALVDRLLAAPQRAWRFYRPATLLAVLAALTVLPLPVFGQREHLMLILALPYLYLAARRRRGDPVGGGTAALVGILAALGFGLKPHFLIVPILLEVHLAIAWRSVARMFRPETIALALGLAGYAVSIWLWSGDYLTFMVPRTLLVYNVYSNPFLDVLLNSMVRTLLPAVLVCILASRARPVGPTAVPLALAAFGFFLCYLVQSKGWEYHLLPVLATVWLLAAEILLTAIVPRRDRLRRWFAAGALGAMALLALSPALRGPYAMTLADTVLPIVQKHAPRNAFVYAFSADLWVGFPLVNAAQLRWGSRFPALWLLPGALARPTGTADRDEAKRRQLDELERYVTESVIADLQAMPPAVVIVDRTDRHFGTSAFDFIAYFTRDARFAEIWRGYIKTAETVEVHAGREHLLEIWCRRGVALACDG